MRSGAMVPGLVRFATPSSTGGLGGALAVARGRRVVTDPGTGI